MHRPFKTLKSSQKYVNSKSSFVSYEPKGARESHSVNAPNPLIFIASHPVKKASFFMDTIKSMPGEGKIKVKGIREY